MAGGELRLGTTSMYMTTYITRFGTSQHINTNLHGYILSDKCKLIAQNQAFERVNRGKFSLIHRSLRDRSSETTTKCLTTTAGTPPFRLCGRNRFSSSVERLSRGRPGYSSCWT